MTQKAEPRDFSAFLLDQSQGRTHSEPLLEEEVPSDDGITDAQSRSLHASLRGVGIESRESGLEYCSQVVGREVVSTKDLSWRETSRVIEALRQDTRTPADVAEPPLDMGGDA